jgi:hypothetical protein
VFVELARAIPWSNRKRSKLQALERVQLLASVVAAVLAEPVWPEPVSAVPGRRVFQARWLENRGAPVRAQVASPLSAALVRALA